MQAVGRVPMDRGTPFRLQ